MLPGVQLQLKGALESSPNSVLPSKKATFATLPSASAAAAVSVTATPTVALVGAARLTVGGWLTAGPRSLNVAVSVVSAAGVGRVWVAAPPSLQLAKR